MKKQHGSSTNKFSRPYLWAICRQRGGAVAAEERGGGAFEGEEEEAAEKDCARDAGREGRTRGEKEAGEKRGEQSERTRYPARVHASTHHPFGPSREGSRDARRDTLRQGWDVEETTASACTRVYLWLTWMVFEEEGDETEEIARRTTSNNRPKVATKIWEKRKKRKHELCEILAQTYRRQTIAK